MSTITITPENATPETLLASEILAELARARAKFPGKNVTTLALVEEVGELAKASFEESRERVRKEAIQVACMAMRVVLDGDSTLDAWRESKGLDPLTPPESPQGCPFKAGDVVRYDAHPLSIFRITTFSPDGKIAYGLQAIGTSCGRAVSSLYPPSLQDLKLWDSPEVRALRTRPA